jgi:5-methylcytosine-specific restriction endonuclease McrA
MKMLRPPVRIPQRPVMRPPGRSPARLQVYNSSRWRYTVQPAKLRRDPLCQRHLALSKVVVATQVDHWQPISKGGEIWLESNLVSLCAACHSEKTQAEQRGHGPPFDIAPSGGL